MPPYPKPKKPSKSTFVKVGETYVNVSEVLWFKDRGAKDTPWVDIQFKDTTNIQVYGTADELAQAIEEWYASESKEQ